MMSLPAVQAIRERFPDNKIYLIIKNEYADLISLMPSIDGIIPFNKNEIKGLNGLWHFGKKIKAEINPKIFFVLPDSFSSAFMAYATGAKISIGYTGQFRNILLSNKYKKPNGSHRAAEYLFLLEKFTQQQINLPAFQLSKLENIKSTRRKILLNINSEAQSRRLPISLANEILTVLLENDINDIYLTGSPKDTVHTKQLAPELLNHPRVINTTGKTTLNELFTLISTMDAAISSDSGIAHVTNAFNIPLIVLFGAGNEYNTSPVNTAHLIIYRLTGIQCAPCLKNTCRFGQPFCLGDMRGREIVAMLDQNFNA